jgi:hypothetical protein
MNKSLSLEYNSTRDKLLFSEYGRCVQKLVQYAKTVENREERQRVIEEIVELINQLNPQTKNVLEYKQKLWRHVFKMADFELDVDYPFGEKPTEEDITHKPDKVRYPQHEFNWRHYGYNIRVMIDKALQMEDGPVKKGYVETILSYMKLSFRTWNKEHFVSDDMIISDLVALSKNKLFVDDDHTIQVVTRGNQPTNTNSFKPEKKKRNTPKPNNATNRTPNKTKPRKR